MKILVAPNSYKECADSVEISEIIDKKLSKNHFNKIILRPLSDGGDGFLSVIKNIFNVTEINITVEDEYHESKNCKILIDEKNETAYLESASVIGLKCIEEKNRKPLLINSELIGRIINHLAIGVKQSKLKIKKLVIGIGGTATIDFGIGACSHLGLTLFDQNENQLSPTPQNFINVSSIRFLRPDLPFRIKCIVDVDTDLIASPGAIEIYGKQKGASESDLKIIKKGINNILKIISVDSKISIPKKLNGAGGGLASGLNNFLDAEIIRAEDFIKNEILKGINLDEIDAVITGEGSFDIQSFEGKGAGIILKKFANQNIPIFLINGSTNLLPNIKLPENVFTINLIDLFKSREESIKNYQAGIAQATQIVVNYLIK